MRTSKKNLGIRVTGFIWGMVVVLSTARSVLAQSASKGDVEGEKSTPPLMSIEQVHERWHKVSLPEEKAAAERGDATAQCHLGLRFETGEGVKKDPSAAVEWIRKSAEQGLAVAQNTLARLYEKGIGVEESRAAAMEWTAKAAHQGYTPAEFNLGMMYSREKAKPGEEIQGNYPVAAEWFEKAAKKGNSQAQFRLAELYYYGKLGNSERSNCVHWYVGAAEQGHTAAEAAVGDIASEFPNHELITPTRIVRFLLRSSEKGNLKAQFELARRYRYGDGITKDPGEAFKWMQRASQNHTHSTRVSDAIYELGMMHENGEGTVKSPSAAWPLFRAAAFESPNAAYKVGRMYEEGSGVPQDYTAAAGHYNRVANAGFGSYVADARARLVHLYATGRGLSKNKTEAEAQLRGVVGFEGPQLQFQLGEIFYEGRLVDKDVATAVECYTRAAKLGSSEAKNRIGELWASGVDGPPDFKEAVECYRLAANTGLAVAQFNLGQCYARGQGVPQDKIEAWRWLRAAAEQKHASAVKALAKIQSDMAADDLARAKAMESPVKSAR
jgi:uncharacterized protein